MNELRDGTANMKDDVRSVFEAVETLVRIILVIAYMLTNSFLLKQRDDFKILIISGKQSLSH